MCHVGTLGDMFLHHVGNMSSYWASLDVDGVHVVQELLCDLFVSFEGALEGKVAGVEGGPHDFATRQAE